MINKKDLVDVIEVIKLYIRAQKCKEIYKENPGQVKLLDSNYKKELENKSKEELLELTKKLDGNSNSNKHVSAALSDPDLYWYKTIINAEELKIGPGIKSSKHEEIAKKCDFLLIKFVNYIIGHPEIHNYSDIKSFLQVKEFLHREIILVWDDKNGQGIYQIKDGYHRSFYYIRYEIEQIPVYLGKRNDGIPWKGYSG